MRHNPALDGIRAIAIALVLARHARVPGFLGGFLGVDVFFVLSGYLITSILLAEIRATGTIALGDFCLRRLQRLYPPMLAVLIAYVAIGPYLWPDLGSPAVHAGIAAIYMTDYAHLLAVDVGKLEYLWSLAVEEKFYLLWPVVLVVVATRPRPLAWMVALIAASTAWRFLCWLKGDSWDRLYYSFDTHASGLMIGSALAMVLARHAIGISRPAGWLAPVIMLLSAGMFHWNGAASILVGILVMEIAAVALILSAQAGTGWLAWGPLVLIGRYSYGLYLWHMPAMIWLRARHDWPVTLLVGTSFGMLAAVVSYHTLEGWFRRRKKPRPYPEAAVLTPAG